MRSNHLRRLTTQQVRGQTLDIPRLQRSPVPLVYHEKYSVEPWSASHSFRMPKFRLLYEHLADNDFNFENLHRPEMPSDDAISIVHSADYIQAMATGQREAYKAVNLPHSDWLN